MTKDMSVQSAVEVLKALGAHINRAQGELPSAHEVDAAIAALEGLTIYGSKFKVGDEVWCLNSYQKHCWASETPDKILGIAEDGFLIFDEGGWFERDCFPTRELAEAECELRNQKAKGERT
jgi:hypothetical protein